MKKMILSTLLLGSLVSHASSLPSGYEKGNGGFQFLCKKESSLGVGVFTLDRIESETLYNLPASASLKTMKDENEIILYVLKKLHVINPTRASLYEKWFKEILKHREFTKDTSLQPLNDGDIIFVPHHCTLRQAALFTSSSEQKTPRFIFDQNLWDASSPLDRAFLLMHEMIYREARLPENRHITSRPSRFLNAWLFSKADALYEETWIHNLKETRFHQADYGGITIQLHRQRKNGEIVPTPILNFKNSQKIKNAVLSPSFSIKISESETFTRVCKPLSWVQVGFLDWVEFHPSGSVKRVVFSEPLVKDSQCTIYNGFNSLEFDTKGRLIHSALVETPVFFDFEEE